jgi:V8-like Glu-specific endopeptidase
MPPARGMEGLVIMGRQPLSFAVALVMLALAAAPVSAAPGASAEARAEHQRIVAFWTPARMKAAIPRPHERPLPPRAPNAKPEKPGVGTTATVTGASWTKEDSLVRKAVGKVFFTLGTTLYTCSGSVTKDGRPGYSLVLTAAHCAYDEAKNVFAKDWMFIPDYESAPQTCNETKYGCWTAQALVVHEGWASESGFTSNATQHDFAFAVVGAGGKSGVDPELDKAVGYFPIVFTPLAKDTPVYAFGYPAAGKYNGTKLIYCAGPVGFDTRNDKMTYSLACDMTGGSSGGPWFSGFDEVTGEGTQVSLNSYGYRTVKATMYGPKFGDPTKAVYAAANSATEDTIVP